MAELEAVEESAVELVAMVATPLRRRWRKAHPELPERIRIFGVRQELLAPTAACAPTGEMALVVPGPWQATEGPAAQARLVAGAERGAVEAQPLVAGAELVETAVTASRAMEGTVGT